METIATYRNYRYWWLMLIVGILSILCGIWVFRNPIESYFTLSVYFCIMFILFGITQIINAFSNQRYRNWGWGLAMGIINLIIGFLLLANLEWAINVLPFAVGFILMFLGIDFIGWSTQMQALRITNWGWVLAGGILTLIFSFLIIFHPLFGVLNIIVWTGLAFIFGGISAIVFSIAVKQDHQVK